MEQETLYFPQTVITPHIDKDREKYINKDINKYYNKLPEPIQKKVDLLTERLELIEHLERVVCIVKEKQTFKVDIYDDEKIGKTVCKKTYALIIGDHDFAGFDNDIESLIFYLLLSTIDTIKGQPKQNEFKDVFTWIKEDLKIWDKIKLLFNTDSYAKKYKEEQGGLSKNFIAAFTDDITEQTKQNIIDSLIVVKVENGKIDPQNIQKWNNKNQEDKLKVIGNKLYEIRCSFTHSSMRTFFPSVPQKFAYPVSDKKMLLSKDKNILCLLKNVIKELITNHLLSEYS